MCARSNALVILDSEMEHQAGVTKFDELHTGRARTLEPSSGYNELKICGRIQFIPGDEAS